MLEVSFIVEKRSLNTEHHLNINTSERHY